MLRISRADPTQNVLSAEDDLLEILKIGQLALTNMVNYITLRDKILSGAADNAIPFKPLCMLLIRMGFNERIRGGHHIFTHPDMTEIINLQPKGNKAKTYQVKQVRSIILKYRLGNYDVDQV